MINYLQTCNICEFTGEDIDYFNHVIDHYFVKLKYRFKCTVCKSHFNSQIEIRDHIKSQHEIGLELIQCQYCSMKFKSKKHHKRTIKQ